jgi:hypothetical protein
MSSVKQLQNLERACSNDLHKKYYKLVADAIRDMYVKDDCPLVSDVLARRWGDVAIFFQDVENGSDVSSAIGNPSDKFVRYAHNKMVVAGFGKSAPTAPRRNVGQESLDLQPMFIRRAQPLLIQVGQVLVPMLVLVVLGYVLVRAVSSDGSIPVNNGKADKKDPVAELILEMTSMKSEMTTLKTKVSSLETAARDKAGDDGIFQAALTQKIEDGLTVVNDKVDSRLNATYENEKRRQVALAKQYGTTLLAVNILKDTAKTTGETCAKTTKTLEDTDAKINPINAKVHSLETRVAQAADAVGVVVKDQAGSFRVYMFLLGLFTTICVCTGLFVHASVIGVSNQKGVAEGKMFALSSSHALVDKRVAVIEARLDALEAAPADACDGPPGPDAPAARRGRRGGA